VLQGNAMSTLQAPNKRVDQAKRVLERLNRLKELETKDMKRRIAQVGSLIGDLRSELDGIEGEIRAEQDRTTIYDPGHVCYSHLARAMIHRRDNLKRSIDELQRQFADARIASE
jgi:flagellar protein FliJ